MNPYEILQVPNNASLDQIKAAFHKRAKETHPDTNPNNPNAAEEFNKVVEAYNIISDPSSRKELDDMLQDGSYNENYTAEDFYHSEDFNYYSAEELHSLINELRRQAAPAKAAATKYSLQGAAWFIGGLVVTAITLASGTGILAWGAILFGGYEAIKGFKAYLDINKELSRIEKQIWNEYMSHGESPNADSYRPNGDVNTTKELVLNANEVSTEDVSTLDNAIADNHSDSNVINDVERVSEKKINFNKKKIGIVAGIIALALIIGITISALDNRDLSVKDGNNIDLYTGDEKILEFEGSGVDENDYKNVLISNASGNTADVILIDGNVVKAVKPGAVKLNMVLNKGISTYKGSLTIKIKNRKIGLNEPSTIKLYEGDSHDIDIDLKTIPENKAQSIEWIEQDDSNIVKVKGNRITALKKGSTHIRAHLDDNGSIYEGLLSVEVEAKPLDFSNGEIVKGNSGIAPMKVKAPATDDVYIYLKGVDKDTDDFAFLTKRGETSNVNAPIGSYTMYIAYGTTWYGKESLFGESGNYSGSIETTKFYTEGSYAYGVEMDLSSKPTAMSCSYQSFPR